MAQLINTNILSLNAQRNLNNTQGSLQTSLQRLSSGLRINSAKDDAAGLAISERMSTQIRGMNQAMRNSADAISLAQTAESALGEVTNNLQRIRELSIQSANATNSPADRAALDQEVQQLLAEIDRVASQTAFNNQKVLDGTFGNAVFQVGANVGETITLGLSTSIRTTAIGKTADYVSNTTAFDSSKAVGSQGTGVNTSPLVSGEVKLAVGSNTAVTVGASAAGSGNGQAIASAFAKVAAINAAGVTGLTATANTTAQFDLAANALTATNTAYTLTINTVSVYSAFNPTANVTADAFVAAINTNSSTTGVVASYDSGNTRITLSAADGRDIVLSQTNTTAANEGLAAIEGDNNTVNAATGNMTTGAGATVTKTYGGTIRLVATETIDVNGTATADIGYAVVNLALGNSALNSGDAKTVVNAETLISRVDSALSSISSLRSTFGAIQNRFESTINSLQATSENVSAARSRIRDADFASETSELTRAQILQQAGVAMLAQANALPQSVLALLQ